MDPVLKMAVVIGPYLAMNEIDAVECAEIVDVAGVLGLVIQVDDDDVRPLKVDVTMILRVPF